MSNIQFKSNVRLVGGSRYVRIPSDIANSMGMKSGDDVFIEPIGKHELKIVVR